MDRESGSISEHLRSNLVGYVALFVAVTMGTAIAAGLERDSVRSKHIRVGAVKEVDIKDGAVTSAKILDGTVAGADLAPGAIPTASTDAQTLDGIDSTGFLPTNAILGTANVDEPGLFNDNSIDDADIANATRSINLPLASFLCVTCAAGAGSAMDFTADDGTAPNFYHAGNGLYLHWDDDTDGPGGTEGDDDFIAGTFLVPPDYVPGTTISVRALFSKDAHTALVSEIFFCSGVVDALQLGFSTLAIGAAALDDYVCGIGNTYSPGQSVSAVIRIRGSAAGNQDDLVALHAAEIRYTATR